MIGEIALDKKQWKYKIGGNVVGTVLVFIMLVGMAALCLWFQKTGNSAIILGRIILLIFAVAFVLGLYRTVFFKVLIGRDGFFYQSAPGNGRYYRYSEIRRAWLSSGRETNAREANYCNYETVEGNIVRIAITGADTDAVNYFIERVESVATSNAIGAEDDKRDHIISGKVQGIQNITVIGFILFILLMLANSFAKEGLPPVVYVPPVIVALSAVVYVIIQFFFYRIEILHDGFYCRTNPFNGQFYKYRSIAQCKLIEKRKKFGSAYKRGTHKTHYFYYLVFTDQSGKERRIQYNKALFQREINILVSRLKQTQNMGE